MVKNPNSLFCFFPINLIFLGSNLKIHLMITERERQKENFAEAVSREFKRILVVEDDPINSLLVKKILKGICFCDTASTKAEAVVMANNTEYSLILMDIFLKNESGFDTLDEIKRNPKYKNVPVAVMTAYFDKNKFGNKEETKFNKFFHKPYDINLLTEYAKEVLGLTENAKAKEQVQRET